MTLWKSFLGLHGVTSCGENPPPVFPVLRQQWRSRGSEGPSSGQHLQEPGELSRAWDPVWAPIQGLSWCPWARKMLEHPEERDAAWEKGSEAGGQPAQPRMAFTFFKGSNKITCGRDHVAHKALGLCHRTLYRSLPTLVLLDDTGPPWPCRKTWDGFEVLLALGHLEPEASLVRTPPCRPPPPAPCAGRRSSVGGPQQLSAVPSCLSRAPWLSSVRPKAFRDRQAPKVMHGLPGTGPQSSCAGGDLRVLGPRRALTAPGTRRACRHPLQGLYPPAPTGGFLFQSAILLCRAYFSH